MDFKKVKSGKSVEGQEIKAMRYTFDQNAPYLYLISGVHGDEIEGVYILKKIIEYLKNDVNQLTYNIMIIECLNPDGVKNNSRLNAHGVDLNRNLATSNWSPQAIEEQYTPGPQALSEPENQYLVQLFDQYAPKFIISYHSWRPMINYNDNCKEVAEFIASKNKYKVVADIGYPTPGSLGYFGPEKYKAPVITFEAPRIIDTNLSLEEIWEENHIALTEVFHSKQLQHQMQDL